MTLEEFVKAVKEMRAAQNKYFKTQRWDDLDAARYKAKLVDRLISDYETEA